MDSTSKRIELDLQPNGMEIDPTGWQLLEQHIYDLYLSPCKTYLLQWYRPQRVPEDLRPMKTAFLQDLNIMDYKLRQMNRMGQIIGYKNYDFQIIHEFTGCHWYGGQDWPDDLAQLISDLDQGSIAWPTLRPANLYRNPEGELRTIGACSAWEHGSNPIHMGVWTPVLTDQERQQAYQYSQDQGVDVVQWFRANFGGYL